MQVWILIPELISQEYLQLCCFDDDHGDGDGDDDDDHDHTEASI